jgi:NAD(P)-dependent dehydrogenase (short-subunit alcohol dehydrogenase family)
MEILMSGRFEGKVLFTTGGGSGLAAATADRFAAEGGSVAVVDFNLDSAQEVASRHPSSIALQADVSDEEAVRDAVRTAHERLGQIDCVFNAAGHADFDPITEWSYERFQKMMNVHMGGTFLVCREVIPLMEDDGGSIVNVASIAALLHQPNNAPYGAAKGAILAFSRQLAGDVAPKIRVNTVAPGRIVSGMTRPLWTERGGGDWEKGKEQAGSGTMLKRPGEAEDIAATVCFLLSDDAKFITAQVIVPDGGETAL